MNPQERRAYIERMLIGLGMIGLAVLVALLLWRIADLLLLAFAGILLAVFLDAITGFFGRHLRLAHGWSFALTVSLLFVLLALGGWLVVPRFAHQVSQLVQQLPQAFQNVQNNMMQYSWFQQLVEALPDLEEIAPQRELLPQVTGTLSSLLNALASFVLVLFIGLFIAANPKLYQNGLISLAPPSKRKRARQVTAELGETLRAWLLGQFISMAIVGVLTGLGLWLLHIPLALALGVVAGLLEFIPFIGPLLAAVPALLLAFAEGPTQGLYVILLYLVVQQLEGNVIMPLIQQRTVDLPPALTVFTVLAMGALFGLIGVLVATPLLAVLLVLVKMLYLESGRNSKLHAWTEELL